MGIQTASETTGSVSEARILFLPRYWDRAERRVLEKWLAPGSVFVDVGSNVGGYAFWAASLAGESGRVLAFEPDPALARQLRYNVGVNGAEDYIQVVEAAVGASPGKGELLPVSATRERTVWRGADPAPSTASRCGWSLWPPLSRRRDWTGSTA